MSDQLLHDAAEQFQVAIARFRQTAEAHVIAISGHERGEGRTILSICLARAAAEAGLSVALVDADFGSPSLAQELSLEAMSGWDSMLQRQIALNEASIASIDDRMTIVPLSNSLTSASVAECAAQYDKAIAELAESFDLVLLDTGPAESLLAPESWLHAVANKPSLLLAHDLRSASEVEVQHVIEQMQNANVEVVGVAQTFAPKEAAPAASRSA